jgi:hypothetical protein
MKTLTQTQVKFKGTEQELINAIKEAKKQAKKQVEGTNILARGITLDLMGRRFVTYSNRHITSEIVDRNLVTDSKIYEGTIIYGVDSSWESIKKLLNN